MGNFVWPKHQIFVLNILFNSNQPTELLPRSGNNEELVAFTIRSSVLFYSVLQYEDVDFCVSFNFRKILPQSNSAKRIHLILQIKQC